MADVMDVAVEAREIQKDGVKALLADTVDSRRRLGLGVT